MFGIPTVVAGLFQPISIPKTIILFTLGMAAFIGMGHWGAIFYAQNKIDPKPLMPSQTELLPYTPGVTESTIDFFRDCLYRSLATEESLTPTQIYKHQPEYQNITLMHLTLKDIPEKFSEGLWFVYVSITYSTTPVKGGISSPEQQLAILTRLLTAFSTGHIGFLNLSGVNMAINQAPSNAKLPLSVVNGLSISGCSPTFVEWLLGSTDIKPYQGGIGLHLTGGSSEDLTCLDRLNPNVLSSIYLIGLKSLKSLECKLLERRVLNEFSLNDTPPQLEVSEQTAKHILARKWSSLEMPLSILQKICSYSKKDINMRGRLVICVRDLEERKLIEDCHQLFKITAECLSLHISTYDATTPELIILELALQWISHNITNAKFINIWVGDLTDREISFLQKSLIRVKLLTKLERVQINSVLVSLVPASQIPEGAPHVLSTL
ncbi:hypothetical protein NEDG_01730 [Nematocida displodere]|uniref:Uncharacterized protein n=1 Tax=Nematocida displodere TaxID=1805483 RepID=A0A177EDX8_9MICR|nr:hypothetical protein NEDG_01730 [Nematocida displodere]